MKLKDKVAIITGGAAGIGRAYALGYVREGAAVVIADIDGTAAQQTALEINAAGGKALAVKCDVSKAADVEHMTSLTIEKYSRIDILLNNAAKYQRNPARRSNVWEMDPAEWESVITVNLTGLFLCCRAVIPHMIRQNRGKIINVASSLAFLGTRSLAHYVTSKGGVVAFTRAVCREVGQYNICVNTLCPGYTLSNDPANITEADRQFEVGTRVLKRAEYPEDLVGTAVFLASADSDFMTGQALVVDGGNVLH